MLRKKAIADGLVDLVAIGHGLIADPHWANKVKNGKLDDINPCIGCGECHFNAMKGHSRPCAVNVHGMREGEFPLTPAKSDLKILVIGAGPGSSEGSSHRRKEAIASRCMKKNTLWVDQAACRHRGSKADVHDQASIWKRQIAKYPVDLHLNTEITLEDVQRLHPDFVVVATGAKPVVIPVPGADKPHVSTTGAGFCSSRGSRPEVVVGSRGGGEVGCGVERTCLQGQRCDHDRVLDDILRTADHFVANDQNIRYLVENSGTDIRCSTRRFGRS